ncbi:hypothetical protein SAMN05443575_3434 [Jatrophihabitans endophyticus]|uniref:Sucrase/ferredoxin-like n=1 Tax=Jatrophihabitans endophyticus TaxID=1206085 RepID=A0A1M5R3H5_9ACTN|nr:sucrase ferredoxin [Jatrophihabitans endophyticus]SHH20934.1 hypothetical protein SAMN05443575_3434 [Jatrophihabitans endophyticus]
MNPRDHHPPRPRETPDRCALRSQLRDDPMIGTAFPAARLLLVEQPGPWGRQGLADSHFDRSVAAQLQARLGRSGVRVQAIRRPGRTPVGTVRRWAVVDTRDEHESLWWGSYVHDAELLELDPDDPAGAGGVADDDPVYLVCAHSRHDACCALRGRPVAAAFEALRPGRVWESSHLGGDRFAANVLVLPLGLQYGRVLPFAAAEFVAAAEAGEVIGALLRGRIGLPPAGQTALAHAHEELALRRRRDLQVIHVPAPVDGVAVVRLRSPRGDVDVTVRVEVVEATGLTCSNPRPSSFAGYRPVAIDPVPGRPAELVERDS